MKLIFASHNNYKFNEVKKILPPHIELLSLTDVDFFTEIEETENTLEGNALLKANTIYKELNLNCFADDSGLLVDALNGEPGVYSARYAGSQKNDNDNIEKLLAKLTNSTNRKAHFKTVMALVINGNAFLFEGIIKGAITHEKRGTNGFGYDPIFVPDGYSQTFAEMNAETKNSISHRGIALKKLMDFLKTTVLT